MMSSRDQGRRSDRRLPRLAHAAASRPTGAQFNPVASGLFLFQPTQTFQFAFAGDSLQDLRHLLQHQIPAGGARPEGANLILC
jgi:hypothetical protein